MSVKYFKRIIFILLITRVFAGVSLPCGLFLPNRVLEQGDNYLLETPEGFFYQEIDLIMQELEPYLNEINSPNKTFIKYKAKVNFDTEDTDVEDLRDAFKEMNITNNVQLILDGYEKARKNITDLKVAAQNWKWEKYYKGDRFDEQLYPEPKLKMPEIPVGLPKEFELYINGAIFYHLKQREKAVSLWKQLLELPEKERKYRSTWAAFMIGKTFVDDKPGESIKWFELTRELADKGFKDSLGLAAASLGWQARAELNQQNFVNAIELYCLQSATGEKNTYISLQRVCNESLDTTPEYQKNIAMNPLARKVVTSFILSRGGWCFDSPSPEMTSNWLNVINTAKIKYIEEAGHFAWAAYLIGDLELARKWLSKASQDDIMAQWIQAKLFLQNGEVTNAIKLLNKITQMITPENQINYHPDYEYGPQPRDYVIRTIRGELGSLFISQQQYIQSLDVFVRGGYWQDAAYIAERILTVEELMSYIDRNWPEVSHEDSRSKMSDPEKLRYLLARRLSRLERWDDARKYYPLKWQKSMIKYAQVLENGKNKKISKSKRAEYLWKAAVIARYEGMEIIGTELEPDWSVYFGNFQLSSIEQSRKAHLSETLASSSKDELRRLDQNIPPDKRFHYRYIACDLAWQAAELMPDNSEQTARVLCIAGSWIKDKEPKEANKFYKALVNRNLKTKLGQEADKLHWFPQVETDNLLKEAYDGSY